VGFPNDEGAPQPRRTRRSRPSPVS